MAKRGQMLMSLVVVMATVALLALVLRLLLGWFADLEKDQALAAVGLAGILLSPVISFVTTRAIERRKLTGQAALEHKVKLYGDFVVFVVDALGLGGKSKLNAGQIQARMAAMAPSMMIYASNDFLKEWRSFRKMTADEGTKPDSKAVVFKLEDLLKAMRKDLGHGSFMLNQGDVLSVIVNDLDKKEKT